MLRPSGGAATPSGAADAAAAAAPSEIRGTPVGNISEHAAVMRRYGNRRRIGRSERAYDAMKHTREVPGPGSE
jgi:hypothetical protein